MHFVETLMFSGRVRELYDDEELRALQNLVQENPEHGAVMPGCGGLRKLRWGVAGRGKGRRSGCRVIYLNLAKHHRIDLIAIYGKNEQDDLSPAQKSAMSKMAETARLQARRKSFHTKERT